MGNENSGSIEGALVNLENIDISNTEELKKMFFKYEQEKNQQILALKEENLKLKEELERSNDKIREDQRRVDEHRAQIAVMEHSMRLLGEEISRLQTERLEMEKRVKEADLELEEWKNVQKIQQEIKFLEQKSKEEKEKGPNVPVVQPASEFVEKAGTAMYDFEAGDGEEVGVREGERITILKDTGEWLFIRRESGEEGYVPASYIEVE